MGLSVVRHGTALPRLRSGASGPLLERECSKRSCSPAILGLSKGARGETLHQVLRLLAQVQAAKGTSEPAHVLLKVHDEDTRFEPAVVRLARGVNGRLPPETIRQVVREQFGRFRQCYEAGLSRDPKLTGKIVVRFVIGRDGTVSNAAPSPLPASPELPPNAPEVPETSMPDDEVTKCVVDAFKDLEFPKPQGGIVTVVYPIVFSPG